MNKEALKSMIQHLIKDDISGAKLDLHPILNAKMSSVAGTKSIKESIITKKLINEEEDEKLNNIYIFSSLQDLKNAEDDIVDEYEEGYYDGLTYSRNGKMARSFENEESEGEIFIKTVDLTSFEGFPLTTSSTSLNISKVKAKSLSGIGQKYLTSIGQNGILILYKELNSSILGLLKIKNLSEVSLGVTNDKQLQPAIEIINKHLKFGRNIRKCKAELEEAGLEQYAQL